MASHSVVLVLCSDTMHEGPVPGAPGAQREPPVLLFEDQDVGGGVGAERVAPQLVGPLRLVEADVEDIWTRCPRQSVARVGHDLGGDVGAPSSGGKRSSYCSSPAVSVP